MPSSGMLRRVALVRTDYIVFLRSMLRLLATANVPSSPISVTLMMHVIHPSDTSVLTRATRRNFLEDGILHSLRRENLGSYIRNLQHSFLLCVCQSLGDVIQK
jgi:hypothetical protein